MQRNVTCKHSWAVMLLTAASAAASFERAQARTARGCRLRSLDLDVAIPYVLTAKAARAIDGEPQPAA